MKGKNKKHVMLLLAFSLFMLSACKTETESNDNKAESTKEEEEIREEEKSDDPEEETETPEEFQTMEFTILEKEKELGSFEVDLTNPQERYQIKEDLQIELQQYFPDYELADGEPRSISKYPLNPAFIMKIINDDHEETTFIGIGVNVTTKDNPLFDVEITDFTMKDE